MVIPKEIREKIEQRNELNKEIQFWCEKNLEMDGMHSSEAYIIDEPKGENQEVEYGEEWCDQKILGEDWYVGTYYWKMDDGRYLCMPFDI